jgi:hypothetical protein
MRISLDIILDVLKEYNTENHINPDKKQKFRACLPLPEGFTGLTGEPLRRMPFQGVAPAARHLLHLRPGQNKG